MSSMIKWSNILLSRPTYANRSVLCSLLQSVPCVSKLSDVLFCPEGIFNCCNFIFKCKIIMSLLKVKLIEHVERMHLSGMTLHPPPPPTIKSPLSPLENIRNLHDVTFYAQFESIYFHVIIYYLHLHYLIDIYFFNLWKVAWLSLMEMEYIIIFSLKFTNIFKFMVWISGME